MLLQLQNNYHKANETLYVLYSLEKSGTNEELSKLGLQKILYLSSALSSVKNIIIDNIEFLSEKRGPYSKDIQNLMDHLVANDLVNISQFKTQNHNKKYSIAYYKISGAGKSIVEQLRKYPKEEEKHWWIDIITQLSLSFSKNRDLIEYSKFEGLDVIVDLVYQDPTFKYVREHQNFRAIINNRENDKTQEMILFIKDYLQENIDLATNNERHIAEYITISIFEYLLHNFIEENAVNKYII